MDISPTSSQYSRRLSSSYSASSNDTIRPFSENRTLGSLYDQQTKHEEAAADEKHELLSFSTVAPTFTLLDKYLRPKTLQIAARLHGMFFLAESSCSPELTCYRRNLFQITGSIAIPKAMQYILTDQGDRVPIIAQELTVSATESVEGGAVKIISVPWKTPTVDGQLSTVHKAEEEPAPIGLHAAGVSYNDTTYSVLPFQWKRLQFRLATANNGRRKELQQHFVLCLKVIATLPTGARICIAEARSGPLVVRGRSPRNFKSKNDLLLSSSTPKSRKHAADGESLLAEPGISSRLPQKQSISLPEETSPATIPFPNPELAGSRLPSKIGGFSALEGGDDYPLLSPTNGTFSVLDTALGLGDSGEEAFLNSAQQRSEPPFSEMDSISSQSAPTDLNNATSFDATAGVTAKPDLAESEGPRRQRPRLDYSASYPPAARKKNTHEKNIYRRSSMPASTRQKESTSPSHPHPALAGANLQTMTDVGDVSDDRQGFKPALEYMAASGQLEPPKTAETLTTVAPLMNMDVSHCQETNDHDAQNNEGINNLPPQGLGWCLENGSSFRADLAQPNNQPDDDYFLHPRWSFQIGAANDFFASGIDKDLAVAPDSFGLSILNSDNGTINGAKDGFFYS